MLLLIKAPTLVFIKAYLFYRLATKSLPNEFGSRRLRGGCCSLQSIEDYCFTCRAELDFLGIFRGARWARSATLNSKRGTEVQLAFNDFLGWCPCGVWAVQYSVPNVPPQAGCGNPACASPPEARSVASGWIYARGSGCPAPPIV